MSLLFAASVLNCFDASRLIENISVNRMVNPVVKIELIREVENATNPTCGFLQKKENSRR